jgi:hypothetical protein
MSSSDSHFRFRLWAHLRFGATQLEPLGALFGPNRRCAIRLFRLDSTLPVCDHLPCNIGWAEKMNTHTAKLIAAGAVLVIGIVLFWHFTGTRADILGAMATLLIGSFAVVLLVGSAFKPHFHGRPGERPGHGMKRKIILIMTLLVAGIAFSIPAFLRARDTSQRNACLNNLRILTCPMTCCVPMAHRLTDGDKLDPKLVLECIKGYAMPVCPAGGTYQVTWIVGGPTPKCSVHGDLLWEYDHVRTLKDVEDRMVEDRNRMDAQQTSRGDSSTRTNAGLEPPQK